MRFLLVVLLLLAGLGFFYRQQFRHALDGLTDVRQIKVAEGAALAEAEGKEPTVQPTPPAPASPVAAKAKPAAGGEKKAGPENKPAIAPLGSSRRYELPGSERERK
jgi:hypothetical protein